MSYDFLLHYGIKGQKWGVKHGPPYPIQKGAGVTIKKGTKLARLSKRDESDAEGHAYVTYLDEDKERYKGFFGLQLATQKVLDRNSKVYMHEIEAAEDLRSPSQKERIDTFLKLYENDSVLREHLGSYHKRQEWQGHAYLPEKYYRMKYSNLKGKDKIEKGYKTFVKSLGGDEYIRSKYFKELQKQGYNFLRDDQDSGKQGIEPSIIIDRKKSTIYRGKKEVSRKDIAKNVGKYGFYVDRKRAHKEWES